MTLDIDEGSPVSIWLLLYGLLAVLKLPLYIATIVLFLCWLYRSHFNLQFLRPTQLNFTSGWAVGWWFIPIAHLFMPFKVVREVWSESDPEVSVEPAFLSSTFHSAPNYMVFWWGAWIISGILENVVGRFYDPESLDNLSSFGILSVISGVTGLAAAILAIIVVRDITDRQDKRFTAVGSIQTDNPPQPPEFGHQQQRP